MSALQEAAGGEERSGEDTDERRYFKQVQELRAKNETQESGSGGGNTSSDNIAAECEAEAVDEDTDGNSITALAFDALGHYLAGGTKNGRIVLYKEESSSRTSADTTDALNVDPAMLSGAANGGALVVSPSRHFQEILYFQSHRPEFDYLKSLEIEEGINCMSFCQSPGRAPWLLSTNDKTIKLWKVRERPAPYSTASEAARSLSRASLRLPTREAPCGPQEISARPRRVLEHAHAFHINTVSPNCDGETFISADDLRINLWNFDVCDQSFNIVDLKPENMEELAEVVTAARFHPRDCSMLMWSSSKGVVKLADTRQAALCDSHVKAFNAAVGSPVSVYSDIMNSISDAVFSADGRFIVSRDYLSVNVWDIRVESRPAETIQVHEHLRGHLPEVYDNDCIFDKFECAVSSDTSCIVTGSYNDLFHVYNRRDKTDTCVEAATDGAQSLLSLSPSEGRHAMEVGRAIDFEKKALHVAMCPAKGTLAVAAGSKLGLYEPLPSHSET